MEKCKNNIQKFREDLQKEDSESKCMKCPNFYQCSEEESKLSEKEYKEKYDPNNLVNACYQTIICDKCGKNLKKTDLYISAEIKEEKDFHIINYDGIRHYHYHKECWDKMNLNNFKK